MLKVVNEMIGTPPHKGNAYNPIPGSLGLPLLGESLEFYEKGAMRFGLDR